MRREMTVLIAMLLGLAWLAPVAPGQATKTAAPPGSKTAAPPTQQPPLPGPAQKIANAPIKKTQPQWSQIPIPPLPAFHPPQPRRVQLANGMVIFLMEDHELPLIGLSMRIRGGSRLAPADKVGLIDIYGDVWRTGGTKTRTGDQLDDFLEARAAKVETDGAIDSTSISLNCLKEDFNDVFGVFLELLREPAFREDKLALAKEQMNTMISRRNDSIGEIASREATRLAYGKDNPYARIAEYATVAAVTRDDLAKWHDSFVHPNNIFVGVVGDFDSPTMETKLRQTFESWPKGPDAPRPPIEFHDPKPGVYYVSKEDVNQSAIRMVKLGIRRDNPDYYAVEVLNEVLGGGFTSRLVSELRTKAGLAYSVGGGIGAAFDHPGVFRVSMGTKSASTAEGVKGLNKELADMVQRPATETELKRAKDSILNSFIFHFDSPEKVLHERMSYEYYGYPADFLERYRAGIEKVTTGDVARVAQKYIHPAQFAVLVVGNNDAQKEVASLGPVTTLDITIPEPGAAPGNATAAAPAKPTASTPEGKALIAKVIEGLGGEAKVQSVKAMRQVSTSLRKTPQGEMPVDAVATIAYPDRMRATLQMPMGEMTMVVTPTASFLMMGGTVRDIPPQIKDDANKSLKRDMLLVPQHANDPKYTFVAAGTEKIGDVEARILDINADGTPVRWYVDPQSGRVLRIAFSAISQRGPVQRVVDLSNWKDVQGLTLPMQRIVMEDGEQVAKDEIKEVQINPPLDPKLFEQGATAGQKPAQ